jgi:hypothetical protein
MAALTTPLFVSCTEIDLPAAISQAEKVSSTRRAAGHPSTYAMFRDHSHISQNYSIGTADNSASARSSTSSTNWSSAPARSYRI